MCAGVGGTGPVSIGLLEPAGVPGWHSSSRACAALVYSSWTLRARLSMGSMEFMSAIEKYLEVSYGESVLTSQIVSTWSNQMSERCLK